MKTRSFIMVLSLLLLAGISNAQIKFKSLGGGLALGSQAAISSSGSSAMGFGININGVAQITDKIDGEAALVYYFPSEPVTGFKFSLMTLNLNGHYNFYSQDKLSAYGLGGLNMSFVSTETNLFGFGNVKTSSTEIGLNIGAGANYTLSDKIDGFGQIGYTIGNADQLFINLGVAYKF